MIVSRTGSVFAAFALVVGLAAAVCAEALVPIETHLTL
jgi:hypothetical protein